MGRGGVNSTRNLRHTLLRIDRADLNRQLVYEDLLVLLAHPLDADVTAGDTAVKLDQSIGIQGDVGHFVLAFHPPEDATVFVAAVVLDQFHLSFSLFPAVSIAATFL